VIAAYDHEALWSKAKLFLNRAMDPGPGRSFDEQAMWASAALELLGKAALARVSPLLIAEPTDEGANLLVATGLVADSARFTSISASTVFKRCQRAFRPFNASDAQVIANARNEYLHGSAIGFMTLAPAAWWPRYWALAAILVTAQDQEVEDLVGPDRVQVVKTHLEQNSKNIEQRTEALIARARQRLTQYRAGTLPARIQIEWISYPDLRVGDRFSVVAKCPACGEWGILEGEEADGYEETVDADDPNSVSAKITVWAEYFSCSTCHLILDEHELTEQAGMPDFEVTLENPE
jgi:hypothetical protein